jgi:hypothetical protein
VHPTLAKILAAWKLGGRKRMLARRTQPEEGQRISARRSHLKTSILGHLVTRGGGALTGTTALLPGRTTVIGFIAAAAAGPTLTSATVRRSALP